MLALFIISNVDHSGAIDKAFAIAGSNDTDGGASATSIMTTPGFKGNQHPRECLSFWYNIAVSTFSCRSCKLR